jgi:4-diphosphocytidyl-2-C-methyl-D-erythritol kinase
MTTYEAPAKINLSLLVSPPRDDGYHPLASLVQTVEWSDRLLVEPWEGHDEYNTDIEDDLVTRALGLARETGEVPPLKLVLDKEIPMGAGLGGGSSDAAATLLASSDFGQVPKDDLPGLAARIGADVPLFLTGGTLMMSGIGEKIDQVAPADGFAVAVAIPEFRLSTGEVYRRWDRLEGPEGDAVEDSALPPVLRSRMPMRNDLLPAVLDLEPRMGDFIADLRSVWGTSVSMTGSGSAVFAYFTTLDEATDAASAVSAETGEARGVGLRDHGVGAVRDALAG